MFAWNAVPARDNCLGKYGWARYIVVICGFVVMMIIYGVQLDLSIAAGAVDKISTAKPSKRKTNLFKSMMDSIPVLNNETCRTFSTFQNGTAGWSEPLQGSLMSSYLFGYIISQIPAAYIAQRTSATCVMSVSLLTHLLSLFLMSVADRLDCSLMYITRIGEGIGSGMAVPAIHALLANWSPTNEFNWMSSLMYSGTSLGIAFSMLSVGFTLLLGTPAFLLALVYAFILKDTPNRQLLTGLDERNYINSSTRTSDERSSVSTVQNVLTSTPFLAILVAHTCFNWGWYTFLIGTSYYYEQVFQFNIKENAIASVPLFTMWIFSLVLGRLLDVLCGTDSVTTTAARKTATLIASGTPMVGLLLLCFFGKDMVASGIIIGIAVTSLGAMFCGYFINHIDIAPNYAGILMALTNTVATIPGFILPFFIDAMTQGNHTLEAWRIIFAVAVVFYMIGLAVYMCYGSADEKSRNVSDSIQLTSGRRSETIPLRGAGGSSMY